MKKDYIVTSDSEGDYVVPARYLVQKYSETAPDIPNSVGIWSSFLLKVR